MSKAINPDGTSDTGKEQKRLGFLKEFFRQTKMTMEEAAGYVDLGKMGVYNWFKMDDTSLSLAKKIIAGRHCTLEITMSQSGKKADEPIIVDPEEMTIKGRKLVMKNLAFLSIALRECSLCKKEVADKLNITESAVHQWFQKDDITFKRLFEICEKCDFDIYFRIRPEKKQVSDVKNKARVVMDIELMQEGWLLRSYKESDL